MAGFCKIPFFAVLALVQRLGNGTENEEFAGKTPVIRAPVTYGHTTSNGDPRLPEQIAD